MLTRNLLGLFMIFCTVAYTLQLLGVKVNWQKLMNEDAIQPSPVKVEIKRGN